jgi:Na+/H+ antiporter NhaD/arsenite permease-like protein
MANIILITIIVIAVVLVVVALLVWRKQKEEKPERISGEQKKAFFAQWIIGIVLALIAAIFMFDGDILGENTTGISTVIGIVGICLIATSNVQLLPLRRK